jgi:(S)-ureidoglycine aminohydrolase
VRPLRAAPVPPAAILPSMRPQSQLRHTRTRLRPRYALFPLEGYPTSNLPHWTGTEARILTSPAMGAGFAQYLLHVQDGGGTRVEADGHVETFLYLLSGTAELAVEGEGVHALAAGGFALVPATADFRFTAQGAASVLVLRKRFEAAPGLEAPPLVVAHEADVPADVWMDIEGARLQTLIPDDLRYDLAMNIFTFEPGYSLPVVETHVMEHGLYFMQGKGLYYLDDTWMEVETGDFIWMGPYVPQSFYATGPVASKYLYYKNVNRDVQL